MQLDNPLREIERALAEFTRCRDTATAWSDETRRRFDSQRLTPIEAAGRQLIAALKNTQDHFNTAQRIIDRNDP